MGLSYHQHPKRASAQVPPALLAIIQSPVDTPKAEDGSSI